MRGPTPRHSPDSPPPHVLHVKTVILRCTRSLRSPPPRYSLLCFPSLRGFVSEFFFCFVGRIRVPQPNYAPKMGGNNAYPWQDPVTQNSSEPPRQDRIRQSCKIVNRAIRHMMIALNLHSSNYLTAHYSISKSETLITSIIGHVLNRTQPRPNLRAPLTPKILAPIHNTITKDPTVSNILGCHREQSQPIG